MANLRVGTGITFDGATGNFNTLGIGTVRGAFNATGEINATGAINATSGLNVGTAATIHANGNVTCGIITTTNIVNSEPLSHRNKVINGGMIISQRNGTSSVQLSATEVYTVDRFTSDQGGSFNITADATQVTDHPIGFSNALKIQCDATNTPTGGHNGGLSTFIEGLDVQDFGFGSSGAKPITVSFYAKSASANSGQTFGFMLGYFGASNGRTKQTRSFTVTDVWQRFIFTFEPNGASQTDSIRNTTDYGLQLFWSLAVGPDDALSEITTWTAASPLVGVSGQSNLFDTVSNQFFLTGVQCEVGSSATPFEHRSTADELRRCQRYYQEISMSTILMGSTNGSTQMGNVSIPLAVPMRSAPTIASGITYHMWHGDNGGANNDGTALVAASFSTSNNPSHSVLLRGTLNGFSGRTDNRIAGACANSGTNIKMDSEL
jgi:hypothetical protein